MKSLLLVLSLLLLISCGQQHDVASGLQAKADSLQQKTVHSYKPGLGEFMLGIQVHHAKLWYAGQAQNWKLAQFEIEEINEALNDIREFNAERPEVKSISMLEPFIGSVEASIKEESTTKFITQFGLLTNTCNNCHITTHHEFNVIKIPTMPSFPNQDFSVHR